MIINKEAEIGTQISGRIFGLDLMRCIAIIFVVVGHTSWIFPKHPVFSPVLALMAYFGVEIFFVLSGFLIGQILYEHFTQDNFGWKTVLRFLKRRWFRTLPNYYLILIVNIIIASYIGYEVDGLWRYFFFLQNFAGPMHEFFPESWSLSVEEFAYLFLPITLFAALLLFKAGNRKKLFLYAVIFLFLACFSAKIAYHFQYGVTDMRIWNLSLKSVAIYRLDAIFMGVLFSMLYLNCPISWKNFKIYLAIAGLLMFGFFSFGIGYLHWTITEVPFFWNVLYLPLTSLSAALFLPFLSELRTTSMPVLKPITFISLISYSMYLLHYGVVLQIMKNIWIFSELTLATQWLFVATYISGSILLSALLYHYFERPILKLRKPLKNPNLE